MLGSNRLATRRVLVAVFLMLAWPEQATRAQQAAAPDEPSQTTTPPAEPVARPPSSADTPATRSAAPASPPALPPNSASDAAQPPVAQPVVPRDQPIYIFLNAPADIDAFWKAWNEPDFVLQRGADYQKLLQKATTGAGATRNADAKRSGVEAIAVQGDVNGDLARLTIRLTVTLAGPERAWVPIRLDGLTVTGAREQDRDLALRDRDGGWEVELSGQGQHALEVSLLVPAKPTADGRRLEMAIPEVASTQVQLDIAQKVAEAAASAKDLVAIEPIDDGKRSRISAHLTPRRRLELTWRLESEPGVRLPELLAARGEIAIDIDAGSFRTRSTWQVTATRGTVRSLALRLDAEDELIDVELDGQALGVEAKREDGGKLLTVPLSEPLRAGSTRKLLVTTRRRSQGPNAPRYVFRGFPLERASAQTGVISVGQGGNLWVDGRAGRGLRQIDLRELPSDLRGRPAIVQAYQFFDQPFELALDVEPAPAHVGVTARSTITIDAGLARIDTWLDYQVTRGRLFELQVGLPRGLDLEAAGPEDVVASYHWLPEAPGPATPDLTHSPRILTLRLTSRARDSGSFRIHLTGRQAIDSTQVVPLALFQPRGTSASNGQIAVLTARNVTAEVFEEDSAPDEMTEFTSAGLEPPADWTWPAGHSSQTPSPALWLRHDGEPAFLPLEVTVQPRTVHHETTIAARIDRRRLDVQQDTTCHVRYGTLTRVDVAVPAALEGLWELDGDEVASRERMKVEPDGQHRYRLVLRREVTDSLRLRFRYRLPFDLNQARDQTVALPIAWIRVLEGSASAPRVSVIADPGIGVSLVNRGGWTSTAVDDAPGAPSDSDAATSLALLHPDGASAAEPPTVTAKARALAELPAVVASRLWLRTVVGGEGELRTSAWYRLEAHEATLSFALPAQAVLVRARVGGEAVSELERLPSGAYRLRFPQGTPAGPVVVGLEFTSAARDRGRGDWPSPQLLEGALVQDTFWELAVPWSQAVVGVPEGWTDENQWYWDVYVGKRRPWKNAEALSTWVSGTASKAALAEDLNEGGRGGYHSYLFRRLGEPASMRAMAVPRAWLVALCSGCVLALGVLLLAWRPAGWLVGCTALALALAVAVAVQPSVTLLAFQSSVVGLFLTALAAAMQRVIDTRRPGTARYGEPSTLTTAPGQGSSLTSMAAVGSDESTAIRVRTQSTREHISPRSYPVSQEEPVPERSGLEPRG